MPEVGGTILRKIMPVFMIMQTHGDVRDQIYDGIINDLLEDYTRVNRDYADLEIKVYFAKYDSTSFFETSSMEVPVADVNSFKLVNAGLRNVTFADVLSHLSDRASRKGYLTSQIGYHIPRFFFFIDDVEKGFDCSGHCINQNKWYSTGTRFVFYFRDSKNNVYDRIVDGNGKAFQIGPII